MLDLPADKQTSAVPENRPVFATGTLIFVGVWACVFAAFIALGLRS